MGVGNLLQEDWFLRYGKNGDHIPGTAHHWHHIGIQPSSTNASCGEKNHPFSDAALRNIWQCLGATSEDGVAEGQPFSWPWSQGWRRPLETQTGNTHSHSRKGFRLGWMNLLWHPRECGPRRKELRGSPDDWEDLPSPTGRHNYDSAEAFSDSIKETFVEEKAMGLVEGPFTKQEAANRCGCNPSELCPGPMAAIDEGDKIRTIYDGSFGGANAHIQQNSTEKTTAPTVMDCVHGIHWLRAAREVSTSESAPQGQRATADGVDPRSKGSVWHWPNKDSTFLLLKADVSKAHRRIKILRSGWKYQVAQIDQQWWVNKVGTYGVASAQLYWLPCSFESSMHCSLRWTGDLSLWMTSVGFLEHPTHHGWHRHCWGFSWPWEPRLVGRRQSSLRSKPGWGLL